MLQISILRNLIVATLLLATSAAHAQNAHYDISRQYLLSPGDVIDIIVYGESDLDIKNLTLPSNGEINMPFIGTISAIGMTESKLKRTITERLQDGFILNPRVTVTIVKYRPIFIGGEVRSPGVIQYLPNLTLEKLIALTGGFKKTADKRKISIKRDLPNDKSVTFTVSDPSDYVFPGDIIFVDKISELLLQDEFFYLIGEVAKPGKYPLRDGITVELAVIEAGGFTSRASLRKIRIKKSNGDDDGKSQKKAKLSDKVSGGDIISIGAKIF